MRILFSFKWSRGGGGDKEGGGGFACVPYCYVSHHIYGNKPKHLLFLTVAHDLSLSANHFLLITFCFLFSSEFFHLVILFIIVVHVVFLSLSHTHTQGRRSSIRGVGQIRPLNCLLIYHIIKVKSCAALCCAGIENKIKTVFFLFCFFFIPKKLKLKSALYIFI